MLHAPTSDRKRGAVNPAVAEAAMRRFVPPMPAASNQTRLQTLQRKPDCACGGKCDSCAQKRESFIGDLDEKIEKLTPDGGSSRPPGSTLPYREAKDLADCIRIMGAESTDYCREVVLGEKQQTCTDICDRAYSDASLNTGGGGVDCDGAKKCACVFDVPPLKRGQCPDFDQVVLNHESKHVTDNNSDCDPTKGLHRAKVRDVSKLVQTECKHRKASIAEIDVLIPKAKGDCKTGMESIRAILDTWVKANC